MRTASAVPSTLLVPAGVLTARRLAGTTPDIADGDARSAPKTAGQASRFPSRGQGGKLSLDEALYLGKEAGIWTTREVQLQIVRSPHFMRKDYPFMLENFFEHLDQDQVAMEDSDDEDTMQDQQEDNETLLEADPAIHGAIQRYFRPGQPAKFWHGGEEWFARSEGHGTRKRASAHAVIVRGTGVFKVNGEQELFARWPYIYNRFDVCQPFQLTGTAGLYDVFVEVRGGGKSGQAGAVRLAVSRALFNANPGCHDALQRGYCLLEDTRQVMSKMPGKAGARKRFPWSKR